MKTVKILDYVAKNADLIYFEELVNVGVALTHLDGIFIVSRKFMLLINASHECYRDFSSALSRYHHILSVVRK